MLYMVLITYNNLTKNIPKEYLEGLKGKEKKEQIKSIFEGTERPETSYKSKRSSYCKKFEDKYDTTIADTDFIDKNLLKKKGQDKIIDKGMAAYYSSGSRPNQTPESWSKARLCSVLVGGPARKIDKKIYDKYKVDSYKLEDVKEINDGKRFEATFSDGKKTKFAQVDGSTFIDHKDKEKRKNYIARHKQDLKTNDPQRAGYLSMMLLWNEPSLNASIKDYNRRLKENDWSLPNS